MKAEFDTSRKPIWESDSQMKADSIEYGGFEQMFAGAIVSLSQSRNL